MKIACYYPHRIDKSNLSHRQVAFLIAAARKEGDVYALRIAPVQLTK